MAYHGGMHATTRHGSGTYQFANRYFTYEGKYVNGKRHGPGRLLMGRPDFPDVVVEGTFVEGELQGTGRKLWSDGRLYVGEFSSGEPNGRGTLEIPSSNGMYEGTFVNGRFQSAPGNCNSCSLSWTDRQTGARCTYTGEFHDHKKHGQGRLEREGAFECVYEGQFDSDVANGQGIAEYSDGGCYEGEWMDGCRHGTGTLTYPANEQAGLCYAGHWKRGRPVHAPARLAASVSTWSLPTVTTWPIPPSQPDQSIDGGGGAATGASAAAAAQAGSKTPAGTAKAGKAAVAAAVPEPVAPVNTGPPLHRADAILVAAGARLPAVAVLVLTSDEETKAAVIAARELQQKQEQEAAAVAAAERAEAERKRLEAEAAAAAAASSKGGSKKAQTSGSTRDIAGAATPAAVDAAAAEASAALSQAAQQPVTSLPAFQEPWESILVAESNRHLQLLLIPHETAVTCLSDHITAARQAHQKSIEDAAAAVEAAAARAKQEAEDEAARVAAEQAAAASATAAPGSKGTKPAAATQAKPPASAAGAKKSSRGEAPRASEPTAPVIPPFQLPPPPELSGSLVPPCCDRINTSIPDALVSAGAAPIRATGREVAADASPDPVEAAGADLLLRVLPDRPTIVAPDVPQLPLDGNVTSEPASQDFVAGSSLASSPSGASSPSRATVIGTATGQNLTIIAPQPQLRLVDGNTARDAAGVAADDAGGDVDVTPSEPRRSVHAWTLCGSAAFDGITIPPTAKPGQYTLVLRDITQHAGQYEPGRLATLYLPLDVLPAECFVRPEVAAAPKSPVGSPKLTSAGKSVLAVNKLGSPKMTPRK